MSLLRRVTVSTAIVVALFAGIVAGLLFGEGVAVLQPIADVYIRLMQMTVLPYLVLSLIIGFGQLDAAQAKRLAVRGGAMLVVVWAASGAVVAAMPLAFPGVQTASFFSNALVDSPEPFWLPDIYFTANPFNALANSVVPAVVLFSCLLGIGLVGVPNRERLLGPLRIANAAIVRLTHFNVALTPVGVFAIVAVTAGTMRLEMLQRLEVYFIAFIAASMVLGFWILPLLVTTVTPFRYREVVGVARGALITAFVANSAFIVLPILIERSKDLLREHQLLNADNEGAAEVLIPILFNFPNAGKLLTLLFVPFASWLAGNPFGVKEHALLMSAGLPSYFAKAQVALPFLLDLFKLPHDLFQLYIPTTVITGKFDAMVTAMNLLVFALVGAVAMANALRLDRRRLVWSALAMAASVVLAVITVRAVVAATVDTTYRRDQALLHMRSADADAKAVVHATRAAAKTSPGGGTALERARARGTLRIGYDSGNVPFTFFNDAQQLVGFDVDLSRRLAEGFGLTAEYVPIDWTDLPAMLADGEIDVMPGMWVRPYWLSKLRLSAPYLTGHVGVVVRDERRREFSRTDTLRQKQGLAVGVPLDATQLGVSLERYFGPNVTLMRFESPAAFFASPRIDVDAFVMPAESAAAFTLLHPELTVVVPQPDPVKLPYAFGLGLQERDLADAIDEWIVFAESEGLVAAAYDYWILGRGTNESAPRWSILRDVLGWGPH